MTMDLSPLNVSVDAGDVLAVLQRRAQTNETLAMLLETAILEVVASQEQTRRLELEAQLLGMVEQDGQVGVNQVPTGDSDHSPDVEQEPVELD